jgi:8-oxo-dGTP pyrophosphatase MutT (NUDIX family)
MELFDVFQKGLVRGSAHLPHDPKKAYAYVEHPVEGWRVYLRSCAFLHLHFLEKSAQKSQNIEKSPEKSQNIEKSPEKSQNIEKSAQHFLVVKRRRAHTTSAAWEPPKGQMEGKEIHHSRKPILALLKENVLRETEEEAHITSVENLTHTGLVFQSQEADYPRNHFFQYHLFQGLITQEQVDQSFDTFEWIKEHPKGFERWKRDRKEKDAVAWFDPKTTRLNPRWCPDIVALYLRNDVNQLTSAKRIMRV